MRIRRQLIVGGLLSALCVFAIAGGNAPETHAADKFGFGKDGSISATADVTIGGMKKNGGGKIKRDDALLNVIKGIVNRVLGIMALVALGFVIFGGVKMVTARGDETVYSDGLKIVQRAIIGLLIIGVSWFIISAIFWLMRVAGEPAIGGAQTDS